MQGSQPQIVNHRPELMQFGRHCLQTQLCRMCASSGVPGGHPGDLRPPVPDAGPDAQRRRPRDQVPAGLQGRAQGAATPLATCHSLPVPAASLSSPGWPDSRQSRSVACCIMPSPLCSAITDEDTVLQVHRTTAARLLARGTAAANPACHGKQRTPFCLALLPNFGDGESRMWPVCTVCARALRCVSRRSRRAPTRCTR